MQSIPKDVDLYVHRMIHESLTKELDREYHSKYNYSAITNALYISIYSVGCNYRNIHKFGIDGCKFVSGIWKPVIPYYHNNNEPVRLPKRYFFSSGMNSLTGYN